MHSRLAEGRVIVYKSREWIMYRQESILAIAVFPSQNNNIVQCVFGVVQSLELEIFSSAPGRPDDPW